MRQWMVIGLMIALAAVLGVVWLNGCQRDSVLSGPAQTVQDALRLRSERSTDVASYERYFETTSVAALLAEDAAKFASGQSPIPEWSTPRVTASSETTATVVVGWKASSRFEGWPETARFLLRRAGSRWVITDAADAGGTEATKTP